MSQGRQLNRPAIRNAGELQLGYDGSFEAAPDHFERLSDTTQITER
ncbi:hypothetical protein RQ479_13405 [Mesorhizobium sp. ISC25]